MEEGLWKFGLYNHCYGIYYRNGRSLLPKLTEIMRGRLVNKEEGSRIKLRNDIQEILKYIYKPSFPSSLSPCLSFNSNSIK